LQNIADISSKESAGLTDFLHTLQNDCFGYSYQIDKYFTQVQGNKKAEEIKSMIIEIITSRTTYYKHNKL
jgi:exodeoxyribonuclease VII large subunit